MEVDALPPFPIGFGFATVSNCIFSQLFQLALALATVALATEFAHVPSAAPGGQAEA